MMIRLIVADDHPVVREGLKRIISEQADMELVAEAVDANEALHQAQEIEADVLLLDISMPGPGFLETLRRIRLKQPRLRVLVLSMHGEEHYAVRALRVGASGYLTKERSPQELSAAIRRVHRGRKYLSVEVAERLAWELEAGVGKQPHELLSDREYQIFLMLGAAKSVTGIAGELNLSPKTVSTYRSRILAKMQLRSNAELIRYAIQNGIAE